MDLTLRVSEETAEWLLELVRSCWKHAAEDRENRCATEALEQLQRARVG